ncbi:MAG: MBOAT family O-acyltransferase [Candidatus Limivicinus sp.]|jgi:alginate O-acetyltransferase complex protein AlgI
MQFSTYEYILFFLPAVICIYYLLNRWSELAGRIFLLAASVFFYAFAGIEFLLILAASVAVNYLFSLLLRKKGKGRPVLLWAGIIFNVLILFYYKYSGFFMENINRFFGTSHGIEDIILPLGISFIVFQQIAYLVDCCRGEADSDSFLDYALYTLYFPKLLMGPITLRKDLIPQFHDVQRKKISPDLMSRGIRMFVGGLCKKVLLADVFAPAVNWAFDNIDFISSMDVFVTMLAYSFQIYFDFSGYSDMASGSSLMLGIELPVNFNSPYHALSVRDFWKRWHMSLTGFLRQYIYFPLGGSRKGKFRTYLNTMIVFLISGIWHGANYTFILWGLLHGALSIFDRLTEKKRDTVHPAMQWMLTFLAVGVLWLLFRSPGISDWVYLVKKMLCFTDLNVSVGIAVCFINPVTKMLTGLLHLEHISSLVYGFNLVIYFAVAFIVVLCFRNNSVRKYKNTVFSFVISALMLIVCLSCLGGEVFFVYNGF